MDRNLVTQLVDEAIALNPDLFLVKLDMDNLDKIHVEVDGDQGVPLEEIIRISRHIEHNLDREENDFGLEVTTPDVARPITLYRQYKKNKGRTLKVKVEGAEYEGVLTEVGEDEIVLEWKAREPKPIGKGKHTVEKRQVIPLGDIIQAKVKIKFN
jgi:ribosome maturation factor RimP